MKTIYILLTRSNTILSNTIYHITHDDYTHASISFSEDLHHLYSFSRKYQRIPFIGCLKRESLHSGYFKANNTIPCALYELRVSDEIYDKAKQEVEYMMESHQKYRYSVMGLILCWMNIPFQRKYHYFCSQFVGEILRRSQALPLPKEPSLIRPADYAKMPQLSCQYQGQLNSLVQRPVFI